MWRTPVRQNPPDFRSNVDRPFGGGKSETRLTVTPLPQRGGDQRDVLDVANAIGRLDKYLILPQ